MFPQQSTAVEDGGHPQQQESNEASLPTFTSSPNAGEITTSTTAPVTPSSIASRSTPGLCSPQLAHLAPTVLSGGTSRQSHPTHSSLDYSNFNPNPPYNRIISRFFPPTPPSSFTPLSADSSQPPPSAGTECQYSSGDEETSGPSYMSMDAPTSSRGGAPAGQGTPTPQSGASTQLSDAESSTAQPMPPSTAASLDLLHPQPLYPPDAALIDNISQWRLSVPGFTFLDMLSEFELAYITCQPLDDEQRHWQWLIRNVLHASSPQVFEHKQQERSKLLRQDFVRQYRETHCLAIGFEDDGVWYLPHAHISEPDVSAPTINPAIATSHHHHHQPLDPGAAAFQPGSLSFDSNILASPPPAQAQVAPSLLSEDARPPPSAAQAMGPSAPPPAQTGGETSPSNSDASMGNGVQRTASIRLRDLPFHPRNVARRQAEEVARARARAEVAEMAEAQVVDAQVVEVSKVAAEAQQNLGRSQRPPQSQSQGQGQNRRQDRRQNRGRNRGGRVRRDLRGQTSKIWRCGQEVEMGGGGR